MKWLLLYFLIGLIWGSLRVVFDLRHSRLEPPSLWLTLFFWPFDVIYWIFQFISKAGNSYEKFLKNLGGHDKPKFPPLQR